MLLGGGSSCQKCGCSPDDCVPCRHSQSAGSFCATALGSATASVTINGNTGTGSYGTVWDTVLSGLAVTSCLPTPPTNADKRALFQFEIDPESKDCFRGGCTQCQLTVTIFLTIYPACSYGFVLKGTYCTGRCSDTGGALTFGSWAASSNACGGAIPSDCVLDTLDWLSQYPVTGSISFNACTCPP